MHARKCLGGFPRFLDNLFMFSLIHVGSLTQYEERGVQPNLLGVFNI